MDDMDTIMYSSTCTACGDDGMGDPRRNDRLYRDGIHGRIRRGDYLRSHRGKVKKRREVCF